MSDSNGDPIRNYPGDEKKDQIHLSSDAKSLSPRKQRVQQSDPNISSETHISEEVQQPGKDIPLAKPDFGQSKERDGSNPPETLDATDSQKLNENITSEMSDSVKTEQRDERNLPEEVDTKEDQNSDENIAYEPPDSENSKTFDVNSPSEAFDSTDNKERQKSGQSIAPETSYSGENRHAEEGSNIANDETKLKMPYPGDDWCFNSFLIDIAKKITDKELDVLKQMFTNAGIGRGEQEKLTTPMALFDVLRRRLYLDRNNLLYLQTMLRKIDRPELIEMAIEYAQKETKVIHFSKFTEEQVNGYKGFKVHIEGREFSQCRPPYIEDLRTKVSRMLFIPAQDVLIAGVEPSSSMLITILIPDTYANILEVMLEHRKETILRPLSELGVDSIIFAEKEYSLKDVKPSSCTDEHKVMLKHLFDQQTMLMNTFEQLQLIQKQLENTENEVRKLKERNNELSEKISLMVAETVIRQINAFKAGSTKLTDLGRVLACKLSISLTDSERQILEKKFPWNSDTSIYKPSPDGANFLPCLYYNGLMKTMRCFDFEPWFMECMKEINRPDLQTKYEELKKQIIEAPTLDRAAKELHELNQPESIEKIANINKKVIQKMFEVPENPESSGENVSAETELSLRFAHVMKTIFETINLPEVGEAVVNKQEVQHMLRTILQVPEQPDSSSVGEESTITKSYDTPNHSEPNEANVSAETQLSDKIDEILQLLKAKQTSESFLANAFRLYLKSPEICIE